MGFHSILLAIAMIVAATRLCHPLRAVRVDHPFGRAPLGSRQRWRTPGTENFLGLVFGQNERDSTDQKDPKGGFEGFNMILYYLID